MPKRRRLPPRSLLIALGIPTVFFPGLFLASLLGWDWKAGLAILRQTGGYKQSTTVFPPKVTVSEVLDGDTFETDESLTVRLLGIDAPDRGQPGYEKAKTYLQDMIDGETVTLEYDTYQDDKFGRLLAYVWEDCSTNSGCRDNRRLVNWVMLKKDMAEYISYEDRRSLKYKDLLQSAILTPVP